MTTKRLNTYYFNSPAIEVNTQKNGKCRSNSLLHYKETANKKYKERISLDPEGELKFELRGQIPTSHVRDVILKTNYLNELDAIKAFDKANIEADINSEIKKQKYQLLLEKDLHLNQLCQEKNNEIKSQLEKRKKSLQEKLNTIIRDSLIFAEKNSPVASMLPPGAAEFFEKMNTDGYDNTLNFGSNTQTSLRSNTEKKSTHAKRKFTNKNEFLSLLGLDINNLSKDNVNVDIDKAWNFMMSWAKGRDVEDILRMKVVNAIMSLTEKMAAEKVRKLYEKLDLFKEYKKKLRREELRKKREEEKKRQEELKQMDPKELIKLKLRESFSQPKKFVKEDSFSLLSTGRSFRKKRIKEPEPESPKKVVIKLNAYRDVDKIISFIDNSRKNSQSKYCKDHFKNIKGTKTMDQHMKSIANKNSIVERKIVEKE